MSFGTEGTWFNETQIKSYFDTLSTRQYEKTYYPDFVIVEAISNILKYKSVPCDVAVFTNIEPNEHGESHPTFQDYYNSKKRLFDECTWTVISNNTEITKDSKANKITYKAEIVELTEKQMTFTLDWYEYKTQLLGEFNMHNLCLAILALRACEIYVHDVSEITPAPWRFERIGNAILDYAHTANSLEQTLKLIKQIYWERPVVTVFGCGGNRDKTKRPIMWQVALKYSDVVIVTTDNPRFENPEDIIKDIIWDSKEFKVIVDRKEAITRAIKDNPWAIILVAGKWNEPYVEVCGRKTAYSDRNFITNLLQKW